MDRARWVPVAEVNRPHGLRGEVRVRMYNDQSCLLEAGMPVLLKTREAEPRPAELTSVRGGGPGIKLVTLRGIADPEHAAELRGAVISVQREAFPDPGGGEFYVCDIVGARLIGPSGDLGIVEGIATYPGSDALVVRPTGTDHATVEIPLVDDFIDHVDVESGIVVAKERILEFFS
jgi:16S rRNA processing protein RimM